MEGEFGIILAGGIGARFGSSVPKQYMKLNGREIISYSIDAFRESRLGEKGKHLPVLRFESRRQQFGGKSVEKIGKTGYLFKRGGSRKNQHADDSKAARKYCDARFVGRSRSAESDLVFGVS